MLAQRSLRRLAPLRARAAVQRSMATSKEIDLLKQLLSEAQNREAEAAKAEAAAAAGGEAAGGGPKFQIQTFNAISPVGLQRFPAGQFALTGSSGEVPAGVADEPHAILLRSHKLQPEEVAASTRAIARCGAGTNNIPIDAMTQRGIPVFNTPGANANSVKELVLAGLLLASRDIVGGINHVNNVIVKEEADAAAINKRVEKDKSKFGGGEILGKTLAVCGLGNIGAMVADAAIALGMNVVGYDPKISVEAAWRLPNSVRKVTSLEAAFAEADYVSINMPYIKGVTHHVISEAVLAQMKPSCHILNFARAEIVDGPALKRLYAKGHAGKYVCDFPDEHLQARRAIRARNSLARNSLTPLPSFGPQDEPKFVCIPHLGASTAEAEDNCAEMAARQIINFLETGTIVNSVNFPNAALATQSTGTTRLCIINENKPGVLGQITTLLGGMNVNIAQQLNTSRDTIAYNVIDLDDFPKDSTENLQKELLAMDGVLSTRFIFTGSVAEGPAAFYVKDVSVCG